MTRAEIIKAVKVRLEELTPFDEGLVVLSGSSDVKPVTSYIDGLLNEAADEIKMLLPLHLLIPDTLSGSASIVDGVGYLELPADFLRLYAIKAKTWEREVNRPISTENPAYALQRNKYTRGKNAKPVVAIAHKEGKKTLELYSLENGTLEKKYYVKRTVAEATPDGLVPYLVLMCAIKVLGSLERPDLAKGLSAELSDMIKIQIL